MTHRPSLLIRPGVRVLAIVVSYTNALLNDVKWNPCALSLFETSGILKIRGSGSKKLDFNMSSAVKERLRNPAIRCNPDVLVYI